MKEFRAAIRALLSITGISLLPLIGVWSAYAHNDLWLDSLTDDEFDDFMGFMDLLAQGFKDPAQAERQEMAL